MDRPPANELQHDVVLSPFGATVTDMVEAARCAEDSGFSGVMTYDHLTGTMLDRGSSNDPFVVLGAIAAVTNRVRVGPLVANMMNRHPAQLAVAMSSLQSLSAGRAVLGLGSGSAPGSRFAGEHRTVGIQLLDGPGRARRLEESIRLIRDTWSGRNAFSGEFFSIEEPGLGLVETAPPPIIIGASGPKTVKLALSHADGVNITTAIANGPKLAELLALVHTHERRATFETSIHIPMDGAHPIGGELPAIEPGYLDRRILAVSAPFDLAAIARVGAELDL